MSFQETLRGVIKKVDLMYKTPEEYAKDLLNGLGEDKLPSCHKSWVEYLCIELYDEYFYANGQLFKLVKSSEIEDTDYCHIEDNKDGTYSFVTSFYNGCTCLKEMLEDELKRIL